jgi:hypothetical protein
MLALESLRRLKLKRNLTLAAAIGAILPGASGAATPAGRVSFALGDVKGVSPNGDERDLRRGAIVNSGDTIRTNRGRAQVRFNDGGYMSLRPETEFRIDEFQYEGKQDGSSAASSASCGAGCGPSPASSGSRTKTPIG